MNGRVIEIYIAESAGKDMESIARARVFAGRGIEGDRYCTEKGTFSKKLKGKPFVELTLIEKEEIDSFNHAFNQAHAYGDLRRNIVTEGIRLNDLVGKTFTIGPVSLKGLRLCEPCTHLSRTVNALFLPHMLGKSGLRAQILTNGTIKGGDAITLTDNRLHADTYETG